MDSTESSLEIKQIYNPDDHNRGLCLYCMTDAGQFYSFEGKVHHGQEATASVVKTVSCHFGEGNAKGLCINSYSMDLVSSSNFIKVNFITVIFYLSYPLNWFQAITWTNNDPRIWMSPAGMWMFSKRVL